MSQEEKVMIPSGDLPAIYQALDQVQAAIEFDLDGVAPSAHDNGLHILKYESAT